ncbi:MAG: glycosyltransferase family 2 protein [Planctomycetes bacterium]|nr:glycosyltransferase family 2 protein [Planctomycetota bacterium]NOG52943.1 glycosyltransferase family 2 protein [Planctomycetota bacterium]
MPILHIVIPVYNEQDTLAECLERIHAAAIPAGWQKHLIIVDDASTDGTARVLEVVTEATIVAHTVNMGKGAALLTGFDVILGTLRSSADPGHGTPATPADDASDRQHLVIIQDADMEYDPADYAALLAPCISEQAQVVYGNRFGLHRSFNRFRERLHMWGNRLLTMISNFFTGQRVRDMECCYKVFDLDVLRRLRPMLTEPGFGIEPQMTAAVSRLGIRIVNVPIHYTPRKFDEGKKIKWSDAVWALPVMWREWCITRQYHRTQGGGS